MPPDRKTSPAPRSHDKPGELVYSSFLDFKTLGISTRKVLLSIVSVKQYGSARIELTVFLEHIFKV